MSGHLEQRGKSWRLIVDVGRDPVNGKRRQIKQTIPPDENGKPVGRRQAQRILDDLIAKHAGRTTDRSQTTLGALLNAYIEARTRMSPGTRDGDLGYIRRNIPDHLKNTPIGKIGPYELDALYRHLEAHGGSCRMHKNKCETIPCKHGGGGPLAASTVKRVHAILSAAFVQACKWGWLRDNPAALATPPSIIRDEVEPPDAETVVKLLVHIDELNPVEHMLPDFVALELATGARPGELCALPWRNVDLDLGRLKIAQSFTRGDKGAIKGTKTNKVRRVRLDDSTVAMLQRRRRHAARLALQGGVPMGDAWVFPSPKNQMRPVWPTSIGKEFRETRNALGIGPTLTLRNLRHFVASVLLANGTDVVTAAKRLGHSPDVLLKVYAHLIDEADDAAAVVVADALRALRAL